jgi:hypothetical protein
LAINPLSWKNARAKGKANYKADLFIKVVEEKLPNGAQAWQEVAALYQHRSGELILHDYEDVKHHWVEKCCNKFKKPTGDPGDPKASSILRCQGIQERILAKTASSIMGADSGGDDNLEVEEDSDDDDEEEEEQDDEEEEGLVDFAAVAELARIGSTADSRASTPTQFVDAQDVGGGLGIVAAEQLGIVQVPTVIQQSIEVFFPMTLVIIHL